MIFGLAAAAGWGLADLWAAMSSRRIGSGRTVVLAQVTAAAVLSMIVIVARPDLGRLDEVAWWLVPNALIAAAAYACLYRGLQLGPIAVVSPVLASYAVVPVILAVVLLGESLGPWQTTGVVVTICGAVLTSADLRAWRGGTSARAAGLPWALVSMALFGVGSYVIGWASKRAGFLASLWLGRLCSVAVFLLAALVLRLRSGPRDDRPVLGRGLGLAVVVGLVDLFGTLSYVRGAEVGLLSIVTAVSATYPLLPVFGGVLLLHERPAPNQYLGVAMVVGGLALLGAG